MMVSGGLCDWTAVKEWDLQFGVQGTAQVSRVLSACAVWP